MRHGLAGLRALLGLGGKAAAARARPRAETSRHVMMRVTLDAKHATPVRQALTRDCAGQPWTIRVAPLHGTQRVRLSLYLPRAAVSSVMRRVAALAPGAELGQTLEVPDAPTDAWRDLLHPEPPRAEAHGERKTGTGTGTGNRNRNGDADGDGNTIARLLSEEHVVLGLDIADRDALFVQLGQFVERLCGLPAADVAASLAAREALGSTGLGQGIAVPHAQIKGPQDAMVFYVRPLAPLFFDAPDGNPVTDVIALFVPQWANTTHLHLLADIAERFCDQHFRDRLHACTDARTVCQLFRSA
jgi:nitrogen PTS system EIIA component